MAPTPRLDQHPAALAILITEELPQDLFDQYDASKVSFPATYKGTGEPSLIFGSLKNLGDQKVVRHMAGNLTKIDIVDNACFGYMSSKMNSSSHGQTLSSHQCGFYAT